jgi:hypothetical protein
MAYFGFYDDDELGEPPPDFGFGGPDAGPWAALDPLSDAGAADLAVGQAFSALLPVSALGLADQVSFSPWPGSVPGPPPLPVEPSVSPDNSGSTGQSNSAVNFPSGAFFAPTVAWLEMAQELLLGASPFAGPRDGDQSTPQGSPEADSPATGVPLVQYQEYSGTLVPSLSFSPYTTQYTPTPDHSGSDAPYIEIRATITPPSVTPPPAPPDSQGTQPSGAAGGNQAEGSGIPPEAEVGADAAIRAGLGAIRTFFAPQPAPGGVLPSGPMLLYSGPTAEAAAASAAQTGAGYVLENTLYASQVTQAIAQRTAELGLSPGSYLPQPDYLAAAVPGSQGAVTEAVLSGRFVQSLNAPGTIPAGSVQAFELSRAAGLTLGLGVANLVGGGALVLSADSSDMPVELRPLAYTGGILQLVGGGLTAAGSGAYLFGNSSAYTLAAWGTGVAETGGVVALPVMAWSLYTVAAGTVSWAADQLNQAYEAIGINISVVMNPQIGPFSEY